MNSDLEKRISELLRDPKNLGEMADADFGYVGSGPGKITLYKGKEIVKRNINSEVAVDELIQLLKENNVWVEAE